MTNQDTHKRYIPDGRRSDEQRESPDREYPSRDEQPVNEEASETAQEIENQNHPRE